MKIKDRKSFLKDLKVLSPKNISSKYDLCLTSVYRWKKKYGLNVYFSDSVPCDFAEYAKTHNKMQATKYYNTSYAIIRKWEWLANCKCQRIRGEGKYERNVKIRELSKVKTYSDIARIYGITKQRVEQIVNKNNKEKDIEGLVACSCTRRWFEKKYRKETNK